MEKTTKKRKWKTIRELNSASTEMDLISREFEDGMKKMEEMVEVCCSVKNTPAMTSPTSDNPQGDVLICLNIKLKLEKLKLSHRGWRATCTGQDTFEVKHGLNGFVVKLKDWSCTCRQWGVSGIPCAHVISAIKYKNANCEEYVSYWFSVEKTKKTYDAFLQPLNGLKLWPKATYPPMFPSIARRMPGRPKKIRIRATHKDPKKPRMCKQGTVIKYSNCGEPGHNKKKCKNVNRISLGRFHTKVKNYLQPKGDGASLRRM